MRVRGIEKKIERERMKERNLNYTKKSNLHIVMLCEMMVPL